MNVDPRRSFDARLPGCRSKPRKAALWAMISVIVRARSSDASSEDARVPALSSSARTFIDQSTRHHTA
jgi:hypothetical protein